MTTYPAPYVTFEHDTLLNPHNETSVIFGNGVEGQPCATTLTVKDSLLAGGGEAITTCGGNKTSGAGTSEIRIENNRFARCKTRPITLNPSTGGYTCGGTMSYTMHAGADRSGYWPRGGYYAPNNIQYCPPRNGQTWTNNVWDDNGATLNC
jgi:hypothetical protein